MPSNVLVGGYPPLRRSARELADISAHPTLPTFFGVANLAINAQKQKPPFALGPTTLVQAKHYFSTIANFFCYGF